MPKHIKFGDRVRRERQRRKMTQRDASAHFGVSQPSYHFWESGESVPKDELRSKMAAWLGLTIDELHELMIGDDAPMTHADLSERLATLEESFTDLRERVMRLEDQ